MFNTNHRIRLKTPEVGSLSQSSPAVTDETLISIVSPSVPPRATGECGRDETCGRRSSPVLVCPSRPSTQ